MSIIQFVLGESLSKWKNLRHLYLGCTFPSIWDFTDDSSSEDSSPALPSVDMRLPIQDNYALDFQTYCEREFDDRASIEEFRQTFIDLGLECRDDNCAMQLWKATN
jgi:hypothetical protein